MNGRGKRGRMRKVIGRGGQQKKLEGELGIMTGWKEEENEKRRRRQGGG